MAIVLADIFAPAIIGAMTGLLVVFLVLKDFPLGFKLKLAAGGTGTALIVAALYFMSQSIMVGVIVGTLWAFAWLWIIANYGAKKMPDVDLHSDPLEMPEQNAGNLAGFMLATIVFILGAAASMFNQPSDKLSLAAFSAPPLLASISYAMCLYFASRYASTVDTDEKQQRAKKAIAWWDIGSTIFFSTIIAILFFVAIMIERIVA